MQLRNPPDGLFVIPLAKSCVLLLTPQESLAGIRRHAALRKGASASRPAPVPPNTLRKSS